MKLSNMQHVCTSEDKVIPMENIQLQFEERDVDLLAVRKMAKKSSKRIQKDKTNRLNHAIKTHDSYYIERELSTVSTYELFKMILKKIF